MALRRVRGMERAYPRCAERVSGLCRNCQTSSAGSRTLVAARCATGNLFLEGAAWACRVRPGGIATRRTAMVCGGGTAPHGPTIARGCLDGPDGPDGHSAFRAPG